MLVIGLVAPEVPLGHRSGLTPGALVVLEVAVIGVGTDDSAGIPARGLDGPHEASRPDRGRVGRHSGKRLSVGVTADGSRTLAGRSPFGEDFLLGRCRQEEMCIRDRSHACAAVGMSLPWPVLLLSVEETTDSAALLGVAAAARLLPYVCLLYTSRCV